MTQFFEKRGSLSFLRKGEACELFEESRGFAGAVCSSDGQKGLLGELLS